VLLNISVLATKFRYSGRQRLIPYQRSESRLGSAQAQRPYSHRNSDQPVSVSVSCSAFVPASAPDSEDEERYERPQKKQRQPVPPVPSLRPPNTTLLPDILIHQRESLPQALHIPQLQRLTPMYTPEQPSPKAQPTFIILNRVVCQKLVDISRLYIDELQYVSTEASEFEHLAGGRSLIFRDKSNKYQVSALLLSMYIAVATIKLRIPADFDSQAPRTKHVWCWNPCLARCLTSGA